MTVDESSTWSGKELSQITGQVNPKFWDMAFSSYDKRVAEYLRKCRGDRTYSDFAPTLGLSRSTLHRIENLEQSITLAKLEAISRRLRTDIETILQFKMPVRKDPD